MYVYLNTLPAFSPTTSYPQFTSAILNHSPPKDTGSLSSTTLHSQSTVSRTVGLVCIFPSPHRSREQSLSRVPDTGDSSVHLCFCPLC